MTQNTLSQANTPQAADDEIDLRELFAAIWQGKWIIIATTFVFAVASVFYALSLPNIYKSEALLAPVNADAGMSLPGQLGGLAALAGVNLGGSGGDKTALAIEILKSRDFIGRFIEKYDLFLPIMAISKWEREGNKLIVNEKLFDIDSKSWVRKTNPPFKPMPSIQETYDVFIKTLNVTQDKKTNLVKIVIQHRSPYLAKEWLQKLVNEINEDMRTRDLLEAQKSISYLNNEIEKTNIADARAMLYSLIEEQTKTLMLANIRDEYVFKLIDPPIVEEKKLKPSRALICILITFLGGLIATFFVLIRFLKNK